ncbi:hypothetical protein PACTADRAFT_77096 [Pachysolen tannophilus NRRL Y-2460]|uniref:Glutamine amidotransferase type-2 domain-containing protein n=1 Tax=Pachysolen tannophilus NRRL Y-2460 TaxID=669874 RepID=A0A1E4TS70_PACTA|nr:hypothetical protein PACTADRAFT_77096 [Pachysolen tannophilus NRRL Y-2460]
MCRFLIFKGKNPILLSNLLTKPAHSIINQSYDSRLRLDMVRPINGDGFGISYYTHNDADTEEEGPCTFKAITPAWNNLNLERLAQKTKSDLVFAHVRASTYGVLSETNCHPFTYHNISFMHNGGIANFDKIKRKLISATDSECSFSLFLDTLDKMGVDPSKPEKEIGHENLRKALLKTIELINTWTKESDLSSKEPSLLNFAVTDGSSIVVSRYISSKTDEAASLHFSTGSNFIEYAPGQFKMERLDRLQDVIMIASEPLTFERGDWITVPTNSTLSVKIKQSSSLAESKGLMGSIPVGEIVDSELPPLEREGRSRHVLTQNPAKAQDVSAF